MVLQLLLSSPKTILRFGAVRALNSIAVKNPATVALCNVELESLVADDNKSISTAAVTTLLRTGSENSVDRLMLQISSLFSGLQDEYKLAIIKTIESLSSKYPSKHRSFISFLSASLREEGGYEYKLSIVDCMLHIVDLNAEIKELGLIHLSEFIEDCEYTQLSIRILHILGVHAPSTDDPTKFIRYIYNRLFLENAAIRAAALSALTSFGMHCSSLRSKLAILLLRSIHDTDDEVRDRATLFRHWLKAEGTVTVPCVSSVGHLESALKEYLQLRTESSFSMADICTSATTDITAEDRDHTEANRVETDSPFHKALKQHPEFAHLPLSGDITHSSSIPLTETETEYTVTCVHYLTSEHIIFQFACVNTIEEQVLENVVVNMEPIGDVSVDLDEQTCIPLPSLRVNTLGFTYVYLKRPKVSGYVEELTINHSTSHQCTAATVRFACSLHYTAKELDPITGEPEDVGYEDDYVLEDVEISIPNLSP